MATQTLARTDTRDAKAADLFANWQDWQQGHTKDGRPFFAIPGSEAGLFHMADQNDCSCPDRRQRGAVCKHMRAVRIWMGEYKAGRVAPKPRAAAEQQQPDALPDGWEPVSVVEQAEAIAYAAQLRAEPDRPRKSYDELMDNHLTDAF